MRSIAKFAIGLKMGIGVGRRSDEERRNETHRPQI
jgi:hypothetical protein